MQTLDLLNAFSHQQLKTIQEVLLSSSPHSYDDQNLHLYTNNSTTPPTWTESETTTTTTSSGPEDFDDLHEFIAMNNLPKMPSNASGSGAAGAAAQPGPGAAPAPIPGMATVAGPMNTQFVEYLAMQAQAQQQHQQQTQQQNQALAAAGQAQMFLGSRPLETHLLNQVAAMTGMKPPAGPPAASSASSQPPVPPLAMSQVLPPAAIQLTGGVPAQPHHLAHHAQPQHQQHQLQAQNKPLALTSNVPRQTPVQAPPTVQSAPASVLPVAKDQVPPVSVQSAPAAQGVSTNPGNLQTVSFVFSL